MGKDKIEVIDKTKTTIVTSSSDSSSTTAVSNTQNNIQEESKSEDIFEEQITTVTQFDSLGRKTSESKNEKRKFSRKGQLNKSDHSTIEDFISHSELQKSDSTYNNHNDVKTKGAKKKAESKDNTIQQWIGGALFLICIGVAIICYMKFKK